MTTANMNPILERRISLADQPGCELVVIIGQPEPDPEPGGDWRCAFQVVGIDAAPRYAHGLDGLDALLNAVEAARDTLAASGLNLSWAGEDGSGIPRTVPGYLPLHMRRDIEQYIDDTLREFAKGPPDATRS